MAEKNKGMVKCIDCRRGTYMQWFRNPIICECNLLHERFVAESQRFCEDFEERSDKVEVTHYDHY